MSDLPNRIASQHNTLLERIAARLPGYKGYQENEDRRAADRLLREHIVAQLKEQHTALVQVEKSVLSGGGLGYMSKLKDAKSKLQVFIDRIHTTMPGYAGFYDAVRIGPNELQTLYHFDSALIDFADKFHQKITDLQSALNSKEGLDAAISALDALTIEANAEYAKREDALTHFSP